MPCFSPLQAYRSLTQTTENGKSLIRFQREAVCSSPFEAIKLPCGQCLGCKIERSKSWAIRCVHESSLWDQNCFITLTFNKESINERKTLDKCDFVKFMKRLRKNHHGHNGEIVNNKPRWPIRFFHCGEYGTKLNRPHHHACLFNFDFVDKEIWETRNGIKLYRSLMLEKLWPYGFCTIGEVTFESAAYVARYITKKYNGQHAAEHYIRGNIDVIDPETGETEAYFLEPEYITMSNRPGIAKGWFLKNPNDVFPKDYVTHKGRRFKTPAYYDRIYDQEHPNELQQIKHKRKLAAIAAAPDNTFRRLRARAKVANARFSNFVREYENDDSQDV